MPFPDAMQEFKVETSATSAQNGVKSSGMVSLVTKSGTNQFHGDLFEFVRNGIFNARNAFAPKRDVPDSIAVVDVDPSSPTYSKIVGGVDMPALGDELHHYGWNACSSCLCPNAPHPHMERRYLVVPGLRSSRIYIIDTKPDPKNPAIVRVIEPEEVIEATGYSRPHTVHCGPDGIYVSALGDAKGDGPGGVFLMDGETFDVLGRFEVDRGPQRLAYDAWWHLAYDTMVTSEWGTPNTIENGLLPEILLGAQYGRRLHFWDLQKRKHLQEIDFGPDYQLVFELRPARTIRPRLTASSIASSASRTSRRRSGPGIATAINGR